MTNKERFMSGEEFQLTGRDTTYRLDHDHYGAEFIARLRCGCWDAAYMIESITDDYIIVDTLSVYEYDEMIFRFVEAANSEELKIKRIGGNYLVDEMNRIEGKHFSTTFNDLIRGIRPGRELDLIIVMYNYNLLQKQLIEKLAALVPMPAPMPVGGHKK